jgi:V8-like Glu-specific endopeptidase
LALPPPMVKDGRGLNPRMYTTRIHVPETLMITKQFLAFSSFAVLGMLGACALDESGEGELDEPAFGETEQLSICGSTDDSQHVNSYNGALGPTVAFVTTHKKSKGALENAATANSSKYCSGSLISNNTFLTAGHCVDSSTVGDFISFNYERVAGGTTLLPQSHFRIDAVLEDGLGGVDYAILRLAGSPGATWGISAVASADPATGSAATIIGHPAGGPKKIEAGTINSYSGNAIRYGNIDTLGGNSGSGVLNSSGAIIGVHTNGGCTSTGGVNFGMRISRVRAVSSIL